MMLATLLVLTLDCVLGFQIAQATTLSRLGVRLPQTPAMCAPAAPCLATIDDESHQEDVIEASTTGKPVLVAFSTAWCGPCKLVEPLLRKLNSEGDIKVVKADPGTSPTVCQSLNVAALPTCVLFVNGKPLKTLTGSFTKQKLQMFVNNIGSAVERVIRPAGQPQPLAIPVESNSPHARWSQPAHAQGLP